MVKRSIESLRNVMYWFLAVNQMLLNQMLLSNAGKFVNGLLCCYICCVSFQVTLVCVITFPHWGRRFFEILCVLG